MFSRPTDAPVPLTRLSHGEAGQTFGQVWAYEQTRGGSLRAWLGRISGRADRRLLFALATVTQELLTRCDELAQRLESHQAATDDVTVAFSTDVTQLRAEVERLQRQVTSRQPPVG
jgi:hypothetical protein